MKTKISHLKKFLQEYKDDLKYLLFAGIPAAIIEIILSKYIEVSMLF
jgi:hypothetical protein